MAGSPPLSNNTANIAAKLYLQMNDAYLVFRHLETIDLLIGQMSYEVRFRARPLSCLVMVTRLGPVAQLVRAHA